MPSLSRKHPSKQKKQPDDSSTVMLMLGLFLILLAFFILLNAISVLVDERVEAASEGVMSGFGFKKSVAKMPNQKNLEIQEIHEEVSRKVKETLETYISIKDFSLEKGAPETTIVYVNPMQFFRQGQWRLKSSGAAFFSALSDVISTQTPGSHITLDIRMPERDEAAGEGGDTQDVDNALVLGGYRATQFARALIERGVDPKYLTTGVSEDMKDRIMLIFNSVITNKSLAVRGVKNRGQR